MNKIDYLSPFFKDRHIHIIVFGLSHSSNMLLGLYRRKVRAHCSSHREMMVAEARLLET